MCVMPKVSRDCCGVIGEGKVDVGRLVHELSTEASKVLFVFLPNFPSRSRDPKKSRLEVRPKVAAHFMQPLSTRLNPPLRIWSSIHWVLDHSSSSGAQWPETTKHCRSSL